MCGQTARRVLRRAVHIFALCCTFFVSTAFASTEPGAHAPNASATSEAKPVYATYLWQRFDAKGKRLSEQQWRIWRSDSRMELSTGARREIWEKRADGTLTLIQINVLDKSMLEYQPSDLQGMGSDYSWRKISQLVDLQAINGLKTERPKNGQFGMEQRFSLRQADLRLALSISPELALPVAWQIKNKVGSERLRLVAANSAFPVSDPPTSAEQLSALMNVQFADLGDRENDPRVHRLLGMFLPGHVHEQFSLNKLLGSNSPN